MPQICEIITTDTVPQRQHDKLVVLSTGSVFAGAMRQNYYRQSIGELFDFGDGDLDE